LPEHNTLKLLCCDSVWGKGGRCVPRYNPLCYTYSYLPIRVPVRVTRGYNVPRILYAPSSLCCHVVKCKLCSFRYELSLFPNLHSLHATVFLCHYSFYPVN